MKPLMKCLFVCAGLTAMHITGFAQETADTRGYNPNSVRPIHSSDIMWMKTIWRNLDMKEKQNRPFMAINNEVTKFIFDAVRSGQLKAYTNDSVLTEMPLESFQTNIREAGQTMTEDEKRFEIQRIKDDAFLTPAERKQQIAAVESGGGSAADLPAAFFTQIELKEDLIFDKQRSRMYSDIQTLTIYLPAERNGETGVDKRVASFKYKDLVKLFRSDPKYIWFNAQNNAEHRNLADAFDLRLFSGRIIKVSNPNDDDLITIYDGDRKGLLASQWMEQMLMEYEHNLWEF